MPNRIASLSFSRQDAMAIYMSISHLYNTRTDENGPLQRIIGWFKNEYGRQFDQNRMKLGNDGDDFVVLYYYQSKRYKICKDGRAFVSSADADDMMEAEEEDLQILIDSILCDELIKAVKDITVSSGMRSGEVKWHSTVSDDHRLGMFGLVG